MTDLRKYSEEKLSLILFDTDKYHIKIYDMIQKWKSEAYIVWWISDEFMFTMEQLNYFLSNFNRLDYFDK